MVDFLLISIGISIGIPTGIHIGGIILKLFFNTENQNESFKNTSKDISFDEFINNKS